MIDPKGRAPDRCAARSLRRLETDDEKPNRLLRVLSGFHAAFVALMALMIRGAIWRMVDAGRAAP